MSNIVETSINLKRTTLFETHTLLKGHMDTLTIGDPARLETDIGPVIDDSAKEMLLRHLKEYSSKGKIIHQCQLNPDTSAGHFVTPTAIKVDGIGELEKENFGPLLHVPRYEHDRLDQVLDEINQCGYGLTLAVHSRIEQRAEYIRQKVNVGNVYVNRNMVGAVVGVQPFGDRGLSGAGPKAGGPSYLQFFCCEQTYTVSTAAIGGNASLLALS